MNSEQLENILKKSTVSKIIAKFLMLISAQDMSQRKRDLSIPVNEKNIPNLFSPCYPNEEVEIEEDLKEYERLNLISIKYRDRRTYAPLYQRKASIIFNTQYEDICRNFLDMPIDILNPKLEEYEFYKNEYGSVYKDIEDKGMVLWNC